MKRPLSSNNTSQVPNFARKGVIARFSSFVYNLCIPGNKFGHTRFAKKLNPAYNRLTEKNSYITLIYKYMKFRSGTRG